MAALAGAAQPRQRAEVAAVRFNSTGISSDPGTCGPLRDVTNPQLEQPDALIVLVRFCGGGVVQPSGRAALSRTRNALRQFRSGTAGAEAELSQEVR